MSHGVECKTTNQKTKVRNFTKKKENRTALQNQNTEKYRSFFFCNTITKIKAN